MIKHPVRGRPPVGVAVVGVGALGSVGAQQVVEGEPARGLLGQQVRPGQLGQRGTGLAQRNPGHAGRGGSGDVWAGVQAQQPEHPRRGSVELLVGPGEHGPHVGGAMPGVERVQPPARVAQVGGQRGQRVPRLPGGAGGGDGQRQRQPRAQFDQLIGGGRLGGDAFGAEAAVQQFAGLAAGEQIEGERVGALGGDQAGELAAAGHDDQAAGAGRQQRPDLVGVAGVVEQHQHLPAGQQAAVQARLGVQGRWDLVGRHSQGRQEDPDRLVGSHRRPVRVEAAQVHIQLPVREPLGDLMGEMDG